MRAVVRLSTQALTARLTPPIRANSIAGILAHAPGRMVSVKEVAK